MYTLLVADDHPMFREAMVGAIAAALPDSRVLEAASLAQASTLAEAHEELDLLLLDLALPDSEGLAGLRRLRETLPWLPVAILSAEQGRDTVLEALGLGAVGYLPKSTPRDDLLAALRQILDGQIYLPADILRRPGATRHAPSPTAGDALETAVSQLTAKQLQVLACLSRGESNKAIARDLAIAETTVKTHVSAILRKLGVNSRVQAILTAQTLDLDDPRHPPR
ncbi:MULTISPECIES: response regulator transcription factor [unclassified Modicisalibacter]|uniref:response regulator n=1 Tax=unclassified Modicisalibacter TaxID=2679913 RepID=UPI001CCAD34C|nr:MULTISPECIES: response regulator transcription factor [unclassified Modicisalibacter]MBZ9559869.1 response regulator transcription factor [Modicisalibacter sp. R2A 31.J]MBZ9577321.1 response regulator transcription factor [Modicisalibacter sp. MOD 31.J]